MKLSDIYMNICMYLIEKQRLIPIQNWIWDFKGEINEIGLPLQFNIVVNFAFNSVPNVFEIYLKTINDFITCFVI